MQNKRHEFDTISLKLASPEKILSWSHGEVTRPETMNYRTQRSEKNGLFDEKIFGPEKDFECYCNKYRGIRYKGIVCEKCGVEVTRAIVRRERMGHITLATPVSHIWFLRSMPSRIGLIMGMSAADLEKVIYFAGYLVTLVDEEERERYLKELDAEYKSKVKTSQDDKTKDALKDLLVTTKAEINGIQKGVVLDEVKFHKYSMKFSTLFEAEIGAEALYQIFKDLDLPELLAKLEEAILKATGPAKEKLNKRISLLRSMIKSNIRPEWMFMTHIPVTPPGIRPMVALEGGRHASSDVNDLYRRVINRNNRLKKLLEIHAPDVILRNEKRILQEACDALIDNSIRHGNQAYAGANPAQRRPLKSLSDNLKGKRGLLRGNLLGKRVDYSGRSVIVVGPELSLDQCGLPKHMALELFKPFVISGLLKRELAFNIRGAGRLIDEKVPEVWEVLEEVIEGKYVLLNRAPTLHRLGIQAFRPILVEGNAIRVHPLVCTAYNADFDGDQMAVHVPLSEEAQYEAREIMAADKNVLKPGSGDPVVSLNHDIILGCFWMTKMIDGEKGEGKYFPGPNTAKTAVDYGELGYRAKIKVLGKEDSRYAEYADSPVETTAGRCMFNSILPEDYPFINETIDKSRMQKLVNDLINRYGIDNISTILDKIKSFGFKYSTFSGTTFGYADIQEPKNKGEVLDGAESLVKEIIDQYNQGFLSATEKSQKVIEVWHGAKQKIEDAMPDTLDVDHSPLYDMWKSGARGSQSQITQMGGMKGLIQNSKGQTIEHPVRSSSKVGLNPIEYFTTTHGSRKGLADTALNTAKAGYLTRRLFDVAQDVMISEADCQTKKNVVIERVSDSGIEIPLSKKIRGRVVAETVKDSSGSDVVKKGQMLSREDAIAVEESDVETVKVFSPLTCESLHGVCSKCYGADLGKDTLIDLGETVGTVAAQAIGEPGTQLTMRTFHSGGISTVGGDITQGLPRVEEIFERRKPKNPAAIAHVDGTVSDIIDDGKKKTIFILPDGGSKASKAKRDTEYSIAHMRVPNVKKGNVVKKGQIMTDGSANLEELYKYAGRETVQEYIISQINRIYELQGESVSRKHIEIIIRQMFSRILIVDSGDTNLSNGEIVERQIFETENAQAVDIKGNVAVGDNQIKGITEVSLTRKSFLSAASFQHTTKVLINNSIRGAKEDLIGLKENVIIGRLIPAGTGFVGSKKHAAVTEIQEKIEAEMDYDEE